MFFVCVWFFFLVLNYKCQKSRHFVISKANLIKLHKIIIQELFNPLTKNHVERTIGSRVIPNLGVHTFADRQVVNHSWNTCETPVKCQWNISEIPVKYQWNTHTLLKAVLVLVPCTFVPVCTFVPQKSVRYNQVQICWTWHKMLEQNSSISCQVEWNINFNEKWLFFPTYKKNQVFEISATKAVWLFKITIFSSFD